MQERPLTSVEALERGRCLGKAAGLRHVYAGNVPGNEGENTLCPECGRLLIRRYGFAVREMHLNGSRCPHCKAVLAGRF